MSVYTVEAFLMFEKEFIDDARYNFKAIESSCSSMSFKELVEFDVGSIHCDEDGNVKVLNSLSNVLNPPGSHQKGVRNKRFKSIVERKCDQVKWKKSKKLSKNDVGSSTAPSQITLPMFNHLSVVPHDQHGVGEGSFPLSSFHPTYYFHSANSSSVFTPIMAPPVLQQLHYDVIHGNDSHNDKH
ncbi:hypothetical protein Cgig2_024689 [Carnegiea gigantea]|uniref:Uncharacterized protein n=1 Tax=Carnegiea gigantea TaxID=171969 RepID=A0A9Q1JVY8_9CARY|nr:hypothetical protein Cgig2_024689 [Carnegiea gigantea]